MELNEITFKPIGQVHNHVNKSMDASFDWSVVESEIVLDEKYAAYTSGLENYSHLLVIFWMHKPRKKQLVPLVHPLGDRNRPLTGLFASRSPHRPNPAGLKLSTLLSVNGNIIRVKGLDAINGSPVVDIKPYQPGYDSVEKNDK
jgi:tRNA-Thr(GGU) m(6)t(6)A37 methyltransferase TsaA